MSSIWVLADRYLCARVCVNATFFCRCRSVDEGWGVCRDREGTLQGKSRFICFPLHFLLVSVGPGQVSRSLSYLNVAVKTPYLVFKVPKAASLHLRLLHLLVDFGSSPNPPSNHGARHDRYDGRGHLHDLSEYDSGSWNTSYQLSEEEARIDALCDEERYLALHTDLLEEEARQGGRGRARGEGGLSWRTVDFWESALYQNRT